MRKGTLTRAQAIEQAGLAAVEQVEKINCEPTSRLQTDGDTADEFVAAVRFGETADRYPSTLTAYYYQDMDGADYPEDLSDLDWEIAGYEIV